MIDFLIEHSPALIVAVPLLGAFLTPLIGKINDKVRNIFVILITLLTTSLILLMLNNFLPDATPITYVFGGGPANVGTSDAPYAIRILFEIDGMNAFMALIAGLLPLIAVIYSWGFLKDQTGQDKFYTLLLLMTAGMLGMILTGDLFNFFVFLEITSIASCALIAYRTDNKFSIQAGFKYIVISAIGALFLLFSVAIFYGQYDALNMAVIANNIKYGFLDKIALVILIAALAMKAGLAPMHMWIPDAYGRSPASVAIVLVGTTLASLYGGLRVIFTIYGKTLLDMGSTISPNIIIGFLLIALSILAIFVGVFLALKRSDFKKMIAYVAVAEIGYIFLAIGAALIRYDALKTVDSFTGEVISYGSGFYALQGGILHILNDALDIGLLLLVAGAVYFATKETSINKLGGLARNMKYTTIFFLIGFLAVSGMPPMNGFASKLLIYQSTYEVSPILGIIAILCSIMILAAFIKVFQSVFLGPEIPSLKNVREVPKSMLFAMGIIACIIIFIGLFPDFIIENLVTPAVDALHNSAGYISAITGGA
jgi:multicomponent Na+:H+ antiporter subunit D